MKEKIQNLMITLMWMRCMRYKKGECVEIKDEGISINEVEKCSYLSESNTF